MLGVCLFCLSVATVAANPVLQRIPIQLSQGCPAQTCSAQISPAQIAPSICPTCPSQTCLNQVKPPCQTCQNNIRSVFTPVPVVRQASNNCPCSKPVVVQNQVANPPINQEVLQQLVLSKILNPQLQMLLNSAPKACQQCEAKKPSADAVPNIINNYIIIPSEYFKPNETVNGEAVVKRRNGERRRKQNQRMSQNDEMKSGRTEFSNKEHNDEVENSEVKHTVNRDSQRRKSNRRSRKRDRQRKQEANSPQQEIIVPNSLTAVQEKPINLGLPSSSPIVLEPSSGLSPENGNFNPLVLIESLKLLSPPGNSAPVSQKEDCEDASDKRFEAVSPTVSIVPRQSRPDRARIAEEAIIKDFCEKHPGVPEEVAKALLMTLERQAQSGGSFNYNQNLLPSTNIQTVSQVTESPESDIKPLGDDNIQTDVQQSRRRQRRPKKNRFGRRRKNNRHNVKEEEDSCDKCEKTVELNPTLIEVETETVTTEKITSTTENKIEEIPPKKVSETQVETPKSLVDKLEQIKGKFVELNEIETTTLNYNKRPKSFPELGEEDELPNIYDNGVDDYYPDFRGDNIDLYVSEENLDRYHYTTDKNGVAEGKYSNRYVNSEKQTAVVDQSCSMNNNPIVDKINSEYTLPIPTEESDENIEDTREESAEIQFRTPPSLELPDFETKQINRYYSSEELNEKFSDDIKIGKFRKPEVEVSSVKVFSKDEKGRTNIETVFGHSKVVRYGQDEEGAGSKPVITYYLPEDAITEDRIQLPDGEKSIVVAKSIKNIEDIW